MHRSCRRRNPPWALHKTSGIRALASTGTSLKIRAMAENSCSHRKEVRSSQHTVSDEPCQALLGKQRPDPQRQRKGQSRLPPSRVEHPSNTVLLCGRVTHSCPIAHPKLHDPRARHDAGHKNNHRKRDSESYTETPRKTPVGWRGCEWCGAKRKR